MDEQRNFVVTSSNEQNSFIADLDRLNLSCSSESDKIPLPLDNPPTPTLHPHSQGSEITRLAEIVMQLHDQIQQERQCNSELRNENANLKIKLGLLHQQENLSKTEEKNTAAACKSSGISKENSIEKIQAQWELCLDERRKKYEQFNVSKKLNNTKLNAKGKDSVKTKGNRESNGSIVSNKGSGKVAAPDKGDEKHKGQAKNESDAKQNNNKAAKAPVSNVSGNGNQNTSHQEAHTWKRGTVLIMRDSILYGIDEKKMSKNGSLFSWLHDI